MAIQSQPRRWIVQKYGGTSLGKLLEKITSDIIPGYLKTYSVAIVCSARSSTSKSKGTTNLLLDAIRLATVSETSTVELDGVIDTLQAEHLEAARATLMKTGCHSEPCLLEDLQNDITNDCEHLRRFLHATWTVGEISERAQDRVLAVGEKLSCRIVVAALEKEGIEAEMVLLDDIVSYTKGLNYQGDLYRQRPFQFLQNLASAIEAKIRGCNGRLPVISGFFGAMPESLINSVGRGYSDLCAALCAVSLDAQELQIWKEVDGCFTADPSKIPSARLLRTVTAEEAAELTYFGSEVIHPLTIEQIGSANIPLRLKNVKNPAGDGTIIYPSRSPQSSPASRQDSSSGTSSSPVSGTLPAQVPADATALRSVFMATNGYLLDGDARYKRTPTAVTAKERISVITVHSNGRASQHTFFAQIAERLGHHKITIDMVSSSKQSFSLAVSTDDTAAERADFEEAVAKLAEIGAVTVTRKMSIISVIGHRMRNMVGTAGEIFSALAEARVNICLISQGASETNISFVVKAKDALLAMQVVHTNVLRIPLHSETEGNFIKGPWLY